MGCGIFRKEKGGRGKSGAKQDGIEWNRMGWGGK